MPPEKSDFMSRFTLVMRSRLFWTICICTLAILVVGEGLVLYVEWIDVENAVNSKLEQTELGRTREIISTFDKGGDPRPELSSRSSSLGAIRGMTIYSASGRKQFEIGEAPDLPAALVLTPGTVQHFSSDRSRLDICWGPDVFDGSHAVAVRVDTAGLDEYLRSMTWRMLPLHGGVAISLAAALMVLIGALILAPLEKLKIRLCAAGRSPADADRLRILERGRSEFRDVFSAFNQLVAQVSGNISSLEQRQSQLSESEARMRAVFDNSYDAIIVVDMEKDEILDVNQEGCRMLEGTRSSILARRISDIHPREMEALKQFSDEAVRHAGQRSDQFSCLTLTGRQVPVEISAAPLAINARQCLIVIARDVTERRAADAELRRAMVLAEQASEATSAFLAKMSHELRTPLNAIIGFSEILCMRLFGSLGDPRYDEYVENIHDSGQHLLSLLAQILDYSRLEADQYKLIDSEVDIEGAIEFALTMMKVNAVKGEIAVERRLSNLPLVYSGDEGAIRRILLNLISNAIKFTGTRGRVVVSAGLHRSGDLLLAVEDTGVGIAAGEMDRLGQPFFQTEASRNQAKDGVGLGLAIVRSLVALHGGIMSIQSCIGQGTTVSVKLPAHRVVRKLSTWQCEPARLNSAGG